MIKLVLEPVPYRYEGTVYFYWEYELNNPYQLCFIPFGSLNKFLEEMVKRETEIPESINIILEDGRIKIWLPVTFYSEQLFDKVEEILKEKIRVLLEDIMF
ncbi:MAG: hypothetical protein KBH15_00030 [Candidatus Atribacteria bacterium]|nr:hypothetical protein [Candidatus Atribacteria bacterium]